MGGVSTRKLVYDVRRKANLLITGQSNDVPNVDIIAYLNQFQELWFNNAVKEAERNQEASNELRTFLVPAYKLTLQKIDGKTSYAKYPENLHTRLNQIAVASEPECCEDLQKEIIIQVLQSDDIHPARKNTFQRSSFPFERLIATVGEDGLIIYHDGYLNVDEVKIDYYRRPGALHAPSLEICDGPYYYLYNGDIITADTDFEANNVYSDNFISDGAVLLIKADKGDVQGYQTQVTKFLQTRGLYSVKD